ncbi:MAG: phosphotransferase [Devosia sp.]|nr:phosphotransferase [Devosia sp.]
MDAAAIGALIGVGRAAEVFAHGAGVLKLYRDPGAKPQAFREAAALALVEAAGLPTPRVLGVGQFRGRWGLVMSRAPGPSFGDALLADPAQLPRYLAALVGVHERIHRAAGSGLARLKTRLAAALERAEGLDAATRADLGDRLAALPDGDRLCHGDFHPMNVMGPPEAPVVVDWLDATEGPPAADLCRTWLLLRLAAPPAFTAAWLAAAAPDPVRRAALAAWLPILAAARLAENVPDETEALLALAHGAG